MSSTINNTRRLANLLGEAFGVKISDEAVTRLIGDHFSKLSYLAHAVHDQQELAKAGAADKARVEGTQTPAAPPSSGTSSQELRMQCLSLACSRPHSEGREIPTAEEFEAYVLNGRVA